MGKRSGWFLISLLLVALLAGNVYAAPIVSFNVSGSSGNWTLDFSVKNTLGGSNEIYFFGVELPTRNITASPSGWDPNEWTSWNNSALGGSSINYNNNWITNSTIVNPISNNQTFSGFDVLDTEATAPTSVPWFAFAELGTYSGNDNFLSASNPGFEGFASPNSVPLPPSALLLGSGLLGLVGLRRFRKS